MQPGFSSTHVNIKNLHKQFTSTSGTTSPLNGLNLQIQAGEVLCLVGKSGCGKTTLLRMIAGLENPSNGEITVTKQKSTAQSMAMVFQEHGLLPWLSLKKNIEFVHRHRTHKANPQPDTLSTQWLAEIGLAEFADHLPHQVSGGMQQRTSLARAFSCEPDLLLLDEPFVYLDQPSKVALQKLLIALWQKQRQTIVFVTHDIHEAIYLADRIVLFDQDGSVREPIAVEIPRPRDPYTLYNHSAYSGLQRTLLDALETTI